MKKWFSKKHQQRPEPKSTYETLEKERNTLKEEVKRLQAQVAVLVIDEDALRRLTLRVFTFLGTLEAGHKVGVARQREIDALIGEAKAAGLIEEASDAISNT